MHRVVEGSHCDRPDDPTVGAELERLRLAHRARRIEQVLSVLHGRAQERALPGNVPAGLLESIDGFSRELTRVRARLAMSTAPDAGTLGATRA